MTSPSLPSLDANETSIILILPDALDPAEKLKSLEHIVKHLKRRFHLSEITRTDRGREYVFSPVSK